MTKDIVIGLVKKGDHLEITPIDKLPDFDKEITVQDVLDNGFLYGVTDRCDGYVYPFWAIKDVKIVK